ncbi:MAG: hypothetical protein RL026_2819 [Pseudomonadota bacterium]|jgi:penicillin-binding protein 2
MASRFRIRNYQRELNQFRRRMLVATVLVACAVMLLFGRLFLLQVLRYDHYTELSQGNRARIEPIPANRGLILDRNGEVLAGNLPAYQLELVREQVPDLRGTLEGLAALKLIPADEVAAVEKLVRSRRAFEGVPIRLRLDETEISRFAVHRHRFPGVDLRTRLSRDYPHGQLGVHALGYVAAISEQDLARIDRSAYAGTTLIGKLGVESARENELHGTNGFREILVNAQGRTVEDSDNLGLDLRQRAPRAGKDVFLAIDLAAQQAAEKGLEGRRGAVVALDPDNGDVLVLASRPGFDPAAFGRGLTRPEYMALSTDIDRPLLNRALRGMYPPGSTIKPVIALAGLRYGAITPEEHRFCAGQYFLRGSSRPFREGRGGRHGDVDLETAIAVSCDVYFYALATELGVDRIASFLAPFGYGKATGIDISGEQTGILPSREWKRRRFRRPQDQVWFPGETVNFGIGQGYMTVTPLQQAQMVATIATRGRNFRPRLVTRLRDPETGEVTVVPPVRLADVGGIPPEDWQHVFDGMASALDRGTARAIGLEAPYRIAGKTGTAQVFSLGKNERYVESQVAERLRDHSWFVAFAPADAPRIAIAVLVENGGFGATSAAPIARRVMDAYLLPRTAPVETRVP